AAGVQSAVPTYLRFGIYPYSGVQDGIVSNFDVIPDIYMGINLYVVADPAMVAYVRERASVYGRAYNRIGADKSRIFDAHFEEGYHPMIFLQQHRKACISVVYQNQRGFDHCFRHETPIDDNSARVGRVDIIF